MRLRITTPTSSAASSRRPPGVSLDRVHPRAHHRPAGHEGHHFFLPAGQTRALRRGVRQRRRRQGGAPAGRPEGPGPLCRWPAQKLFGRRGADLDGARLRDVSSRRCAMAARSARCASFRRTPCSSATTNQVGKLRGETANGFGYGFETRDRYGVQRHGIGGFVGLGRRLRHLLPRRSRGAPDHGAR